jgi:hypothetical protein
VELLERIEAHIRANDLIAPRGEILCLVSGGPDSTCLYHALRELGYKVSALHVNYGLRGCESDDDARFCEREMDAEVFEFDARGASEAELRGCALQGIPPPTRPRRSSTGSSRAGTRKGSRRSARMASSARCSRSGVRRPRRSATSAG